MTEHSKRKYAAFEQAVVEAVAANPGIGEGDMIAAFKEHRPELQIPKSPMGAIGLMAKRGQLVRIRTPHSTREFGRHALSPVVAKPQREIPFHNNHTVDVQATRHVPLPELVQKFEPPKPKLPTVQEMPAASEQRNMVQLTTGTLLYLTVPELLEVEKYVVDQRVRWGGSTL